MTTATKTVLMAIPEDMARRNLAYTLGFTNQGFELSQLRAGRVNSIRRGKGKETPTPLGIPAEQYADRVRFVLGSYAESDEMYDQMMGELKAWLSPDYGKEVSRMPIPELKKYVQRVWPDIFSHMVLNRLW